jgi:hypothetical protein
MEERPLIELGGNGDPVGHRLWMGVNGSVNSRTNIKNKYYKPNWVILRGLR